MIAKGLPASPGAASGKIVFTADEAEKQARAGEKVILVRRETSPEDIHGMHAAEGILTSTGGMTSHAAVVARGMGKPCVAGAGDVRIDGAAGTLSVRGTIGEDGRDHHARRHAPARSCWASCRPCSPSSVGRLRRADGLGRRVPHA